MIKKIISVFILSSFAQLCFAHAPGLSSADFVLSEKNVDATITFALQDIEAFSPLDMDGDALVSDAEKETAKPAIAALVAKELPLSINEQLAQSESSLVTFDEQNNVKIVFHFETAPNHLKMTDLLLNKLPEGHKQYVTLKDASGKTLTEKMLSKQDNFIEFSFQAPATSSSMFQEFFVLGVEHILTGYDHLLFLFALLIVTHCFWEAFGIITFFTIAHSITLGLAGSNLVTLPSSFIEPAIAASIVYVGVENILRKEPKGRRYLTFAFGLIHGFGFAAVLQEMGIGNLDTGILIPLFSFNIGVETGQIIVTALVLPVIWWLHTKPLVEKYFVPVCSTIVCLAGSFWFIERTIL